MTAQSAYKVVWRMVIKKIINFHSVSVVVGKAPIKNLEGLEATFSMIKTDGIQ